MSVLTMSPADYLIRRVLDAFLRENYRAIASRAVETRVPELDDQPWLSATLDGGDGTPLLLPVTPGRFLCDWTIRRPAVVVNGRLISDFDAVLAIFQPCDNPEAEAGYAAFITECHAALMGLTLGEQRRSVVVDSLSSAVTTGVSGALAYEVLAAHLDHPVYPTARCRRGIDAADLERYAPEFAPTFHLQWVAVPRDTATREGRLPACWPRSQDVGLPADLDETHVLFPVHPLALGGPIHAAFEVTGLASQAVPALVPYLQVTPTLSVRTLALVQQPDIHIKVPLPTSTLGMRNVRSIQPDTLLDGDVIQRLLRNLLADEPHLKDRVLLTDETTYGHAGHQFLSYLVRRYPVGLDTARVVSCAALLAEGLDGRPVMAALADEYFGGSVLGLLDAYLTVLFQLHVTLWLRYGIALEAHQQNTSIVLEAGRPLRLLYKDNDGARIDPRALGYTPAVKDIRILVSDPAELADVFTTITVHLCAGAFAFGLAELGLADLDAVLALIRRRLIEAAEPFANQPATQMLRTRVLEAERLPVKSMVTAGTLLPKARTGAVDINKFYGTTGPNYLRAAAR